MATRATYVPHYTVTDLERWEDRWELIGGIPHAMSPAPAIRHQQVSLRVALLLEEALAGCPPCLSLQAVNWRISEETIVIPDNLVVCTDEPPEGVYLTAPPVLIVEVLSPSTSLKDRVVKRELYEEEGVRHYVLVDPVAETAEGLELDEGRYRRRFDTGTETVAFELGPCVAEFDLARLWQR